MSVSASRHTENGLPGVILRIDGHERFVPRPEAERLGAFLVGENVGAPVIVTPSETLKRLGIWEESTAWA